MDWDWKYLFTSFDGRINRAKYWGAALAFGIPAFLIQMLLFWVLGFIITTIVSLVFLYPTYALLLKRGNDRDRPAWITQALDRKSTRLNSSHSQQSRMPSSA